MKISERQILFLMEILRGSLRVADNANIWGYTVEQRQDMFNTLLEQQGSELVDVRNKPDKTIVAPESDYINNP